MLKPLLALIFVSTIALSEPTVLPHFTQYKVVFQCGESVLKTTSSSVNFSNEYTKITMESTMDDKPKISILCNGKPFEISKRINKRFVHEGTGMLLSVTKVAKKY